MWSVLVLSAATFLGAPDVTATTLDGKVQTGTLVAATNQGIVLETSAGKVTLSAESLATVRSQTLPSKPKAAVQVELIDGSQLQGAEFRFAAGKVALIGLDKSELALTRRGIKWVRFPQEKTFTPAAWQQALNTAAAGDLLVVRKAGGNGQAVLDPLEGMVQSVGAQSIGFQFDGDTIQVKSEKVEGIVFFKSATAGNQPLVCRVHSHNWGTLQAAEISFAADKLQVTTISGVEVAVPWNAGTQLDFRSGNIQWLAELTPDTVQSKFSLQPSGMTFGFDHLFRPQAGGPFGGSGLKLGKQTFESGLTLHSPTTLTYRIPAGFSRFRATIGLADEAATEANVQVQLLGDQKELWAKTFTASGMVEPVEVECDLATARRLSVVIDPGTGLDLGDVIILGNARFVK